MSFKNKIISKDVTKIFDDNEIEDLKKFMNKRHFINNCNLFIIYLFHFIQSAGILVTTIATGYNKKYLIWVGIGLNILASLINVYEKINNNVLKKLMIDIQKIKDGNYIDETTLIDTENISEQNNIKTDKTQLPLFIDSENNQNKITDI